MKILLNEEIKQKCIDLLITFDSICKKNNINYFLAFGTLLGAIRHNGFIPWDDDIDVWVNQSDYEKLKLAFNNVKGVNFIDYIGDSKSIWVWGKVSNSKTLVIDNEIRRNQILETPRGISIDVFPLFPIKNSKNFIKKINHLTKHRAKKREDLAKYQLTDLCIYIQSI